MSGLASFVVFVRSSFLIFSGVNFCFWRCGSCYSGAVLPLFLFIFWFFVPENVENSLLVRSVFLNEFSGANFCLWPP